ncbi:MAG: DUF1684 domain-containing protein [Bacteroidota bacterium]
MEKSLNNRKNSGYIAAVIGAVFLVIILFSQLANNPSRYDTRMEESRAAKDLQFTNDPQSPIPIEERRSFQGLTYFPIDESYLAPASLLPADTPDTLTLMTTTGSDYQVVVAGKLQFTLQGITHQLTAYGYLESERESYFVPFSDLTSGVSTYGGGRYLDVPKGSKLIMDFNTAYHPYCVYNATFVCPLPPSENNLTIEIRAGERNPDSRK